MDNLIVVDLISTPLCYEIITNIIKYLFLLFDFICANLIFLLMAVN